jgi:imidazolonepropionase-like amidohydrolase
MPPAISVSNLKKHYGDIVAVDGDPLKDVRVLEHVSAVIKGGELVK